MFYFRAAERALLSFDMKTAGSLSEHGLRLDPPEELRIKLLGVLGEASALAGDWASARRVDLVLPETGVCNRSPVPDEPAAASACCGAGSRNAPPAGEDLLTIER